MIRYARDFRLIPIVLLATVCLFALKVSGLVFDGGYTLGERLQGRNKSDLQITTADSVPDYPKIVVANNSVIANAAGTASNKPSKPWAQEMFGYNDRNNGDVTGSVGAKEEKPAGPPLPTSTKVPEAPKLDVGGSSFALTPGKINSPGERAVLERLQDRREALDGRTRDLEMRENLLKAAEMRVEAKVAELKDVENRVNSAIGNRDKAEAQRFKNIVSMYESMKSKDAARIFDRLDLRILVEVSTQIKPAKMAEILAAMTGDSAERLTVELANRATATPKSEAAGQLPKIEGKIEAKPAGG
ncbi:MAG: flagellar protein FlbB [Pseudolabrys sp.]